MVIPVAPVMAVKKAQDTRATTPRPPGSHPKRLLEFNGNGGKVNLANIKAQHGCCQDTYKKGQAKNDQDNKQYDQYQDHLVFPLAISSP